MTLIIDPPLDGNGRKRDLPPDYEQLKPWFGIIRHANRSIIRGSIQWMVITAYIDEQGRPMIHGQPDVLKCRLE